MNLFEYALDHSKYHSETDMRMMMNKKEACEVFENAHIGKHCLEEWNEVLSFVMKRGRFRPKNSMEEIYVFLGRKEELQKKNKK